MNTRDRIVLFMQTFRAENGYPPSIRSIAEGVGLSSTNTVHTHLATLEREGRVIRRQISERRWQYDLPRLGVAS